MRTKILLLFLLGWVGMVSAQNLISLEKKYSKEKEDQPKDKEVKPFKVNGRINNNVFIDKTNTFVIEYDYKDGVYTRNLPKLKVGTPVVFKITNINRLAYDASISTKDSLLSGTFSFDSPYSYLPIKASEPKSKNENINSTNNQPKDITTINNADVSKSSEGKADILKEINVISKQEILKKEIQELTNKLSDEKRNLKNLIDLNNIEINKLREEIKNDTLKTNLNNNLITDINKVNQSLILFETSLSTNQIIRNNNLEKQANVDNILELRGELLKKQEMFDSLELVKNEALKKFSDDQEKLIIAFVDLKSYYEKVDRITNYYKEVYEITSNTELTQEQYQKEYKESLMKVLLNINYFRDDLSKFKEKCGDFDMAYNYIKYNPGLESVLNYGGIVKMYAHADYLNEHLNNIKKNIQSFDFDEMINYMTQNIPLLDKESTYYVVSNPIQPIFDVAIFNIDIKKRNNNRSTLKAERKFSHKEYTYGGTRLDFGIGLAGSLYPNARSYELVIGQDSVQIHQKSKQIFVPSVLGMATMSYRSASYVTYGASVGLGIDVTNGKIQLSNFFAGPSIIFGKHDRLTFTTGASVRAIDRLKGNYSVNTNMPITESSSDLKNFVTTEYRVGFFVSLTYNLTRGVKDNVQIIKTLF